MGNTVTLSADFNIGDVLSAISIDDAVDVYGIVDLLDEIGLPEAVEHFKTNELLDEIGQQEAMGHFGLVEPEQEKASEVQTAT